MRSAHPPLKVCLVRPPAKLNVKAINRYSVPPLGLAYIAAAIQKGGFKVQVVDAIGEAIHQYSAVSGNPGALHYGLKFEEILSRIDPETDVIGISIMFSREWLICKALIEAIRKRFPRALIIVGGEHVTACVEYSMETCTAIDAAVLGEGEETVLDLLRARQEERPLHSVNGIVFRSGGTLIKTSARKRIKDIDSISQPAWELFPLEEYIRNAYSLGFDIGRSAPLLASRGCPFQCTFCSNPTMWTPNWAARNPAQVIEEMKEHMEKYRVTNFDFYDLTAIVKKAWIIEFCTLLIEKKLNVTWQLPSGTRSEALDEETLDWMYRAGCRSVIYAPESGSPAELKRIKKKVILTRMLASMRFCTKKGIRSKANIIFGMPGSTWSDVFKTYFFLLKMSWVGVNNVGCFAFSPYPGSELFRELLAKNIIKLDDDYFNELSQFKNFTGTRSFNENFSGWQLTLINVTGMAIFYSSNVLFRPVRLIDFFNVLFTQDISSPLARSLSNFRNRKMAYQLLAASGSDTIQLPISPRHQ